MAVTCRDIMNLDICQKLKLIGGAEGIDRVVTWPFIKNMDTISEWTHGGEILFIIGAKEDTSEKGLISVMKEAAQKNISGVVMLNGDEYIKTIPKSVIKQADDNKLPLFKMPFMLKLIDITKEISKLIVEDRKINTQHSEADKSSLLEKLMSGMNKDELLTYCYMKLQPLTEADKVLKTEYIKTLRCYLECNNDLLHTSKVMYIHRNTLINRMKKITTLLDIQINNSENRNNFYNIFKYLEYYGEI